MQPNSDMPLNGPEQGKDETAFCDQASSSGLLPIPPMIQRSQAAFRRDMHLLMKTHHGQWVAYHGEKRLGFARSKVKLVQECLRKGLKDDEFVVRGIGPEMPDDGERVV
jgi:hypothetical protein